MAKLRILRAAALLLCGALFFLLETLPAPPPRSRVQAAAEAPAARRAALLFYGKTGSILTQEHDLIMSGLKPPAMDAVHSAWPTVLANVLAHNAAGGWEVDVYFHTWDAVLEAPLVRLMQPLAHMVGPGEIEGSPRTTGPFASVELGLNLVRNSSRAYSRVLVTRFDVLFRTPFALDELRDDSALHVAHWCVAEGAFVEPWLVPGAEGAVLCRGLRNVPIDEVGFPDFYFAGSLRTLLAYAQGLVESSELVIYHEVRVRYDVGLGAINHFVWAGHALVTGMRVRRYLVHHADLIIARLAHSCSADAESTAALPANATTWLVRPSPEGRVSAAAESECPLHGQLACARVHREWHQCPLFRFG